MSTIERRAPEFVPHGNTWGLPDISGDIPCEAKSPPCPRPATWRIYYPCRCVYLACDPHKLQDEHDHKSLRFWNWNCVRCGKRVDPAAVKYERL